MKAIVKRWVELFNKAEAKGLAQLYHPDAVNHQVNTAQVEGRESIQRMFESEFAAADMTCIVENIFEDGDWAILEWKDPLGLRGCGFFFIEANLIKFQRGYWDKLSFLKMHHLPLPTDS